MAHFYGTLHGNRGETSRCGSESSGLRSSTNGWDLGVDVRACVREGIGDVVEVFLTGGSDCPELRFHLGTYCRANLDKMLNQVSVLRRNQ